MRLDGVENDNRARRVLRRFAHRLRRVVQRVLTADDAAGFAGQVDAGFARQTERRSVLVQAGFAQTTAALIEEVVAGVGKSIHNRLIVVLAAVALGNPALRSGGQVGVVGGVVAHIRNHLVRLQYAGVQRAEARHHLENRAGGCARADGVVQHQVAVIGQNRARLVAAGNQRVQVIGGVVRHGQHTRLHVQHKHHAVLCQFQRVMLPVVGGNQCAVVFQPLAGDHQILLLVADAGDVGGNRTLRHGLVVHIQRQLDVVAVRRLGVGDFAHDFRPVVALDDAAALAQGTVLRQPILHR